MKDNLLGILKLICFILILPLLFALVSSLYGQLVIINPSKSQALLYGVLIFAGVYLFLYDFKQVHEVGQTGLNKLLTAINPAVGTLSIIIPLYTLILCLVFVILKALNVLGKYENFALIIISFFWMMHVVLTAKQLQEGEKSVVKGGYFFGFGIALIFHIIVASLLLLMIVDEFSLGNFVKHASQQTANYYHSIYKLLFVPS